MKQERINKTVIFLGIFLMISSKAFGVTAFDPNNVSGAISTASGQVRLSHSGTPTYDSQNDTYNVPAVIGEEVSAPDPARAAQGDATSKPVIVGNQVGMTLPGTDMVQLANGIWTNNGAPPSETLTTALESVTEQPDTVLTLAVNDIFSNDGDQTCKKVTSVITYPRATIAANGCDIFYNSMFPFNTTFGHSTNPAQTEFHVATGCEPLIDHGYTYAITFVRTAIQCTSAPCPSNYNPSPSPPSSDDLAGALTTALNNWSNNHADLAQDFKNAAENGNPFFPDGSEPSQADIDNWKLQNQSNVNNTISSGLGSGIGPDGKRPCGDQGTQGP